MSLRAHSSPSGGLGSSTSPLFAVASAAPAPAARHSCATLQDLCLAEYHHHLDELGSAMHLLPEPLVQELLYRVYVGGGLTPSLVRLFDASGHDSIVQWIAKNVRLDRAILINQTASCRANR